MTACAAPAGAAAACQRRATRAVVIPPLLQRRHLRRRRAVAESSFNKFVKAMPPSYSLVPRGPGHTPANDARDRRCGGLTPHTPRCARNSAATDPRAMYRFRPARDEGSTWHSQFYRLPLAARRKRRTGFRASPRAAARLGHSASIFPRHARPAAKSKARAAPARKRPRAARSSLISGAPLRGAPESTGPLTPLAGRCGARAVVLVLPEAHFRGRVLPFSALRCRPRRSAKVPRQLAQASAYPRNPGSAARGRPALYTTPSKPQLSRAFHRLGPRWVRRHRRAEKGGQA